MRFPSLALLWYCTPVIPASNIEPNPVEPAPSTADTSDTGSPDTNENIDVQAEPHAEVHCILEVSWNRISSADGPGSPEFEAQDTLTSPSQPAEAGAIRHCWAHRARRKCNTALSLWKAMKHADRLSTALGQVPRLEPARCRSVDMEPVVATSDRWVLGVSCQSRLVWRTHRIHHGSTRSHCLITKSPIVASRCKPKWLGMAVIRVGGLHRYVWDVEPTVTRLSLDYSTIDITELPQLGFLDEIENGTISPNLILERSSNDKATVPKE